MKQIWNDIINFFINIWSSIWWFFWNIETYLILTLLIYIIIVTLLVIWFRYSRKTFMKVNTLFKKDIDDLYYQTSLILYNNKEDIHEFQSNIPLLLQYKRQEIQRKNKANYISHYNKLIEEIEYIAELTNNSLIYNREELNKKHHLAQNLAQNSSYMQNTLSVFTLGVSNLFF